MKATKGERSDDRRSADGTQAGPQATLKAPWPDQKARREMSDAELAREDGKHDKNADWKKTW